MPLLIGGATTSRVHTAVKISPAYHGPVVHVLDASRAVGVFGNLLSAELRGAFVAENRKAQDRAREQHSGRKPQRSLLSIEEARARGARLEWRPEDIPVPAFTGTRVLDRFPLDRLVPYIDWSPFFHVWELRGRYPQLLDDPVAGPRAREVIP